ncbi:DUF4055 domain-containing protein [Castellaniella denitrificans]|uniref:DUF4055 domain-containing protein n=1 Tax=Castellaniella denitrificans TaxID=56119 RepID=A0ABT4M6Z0_9BURK|nr:DUF4055 domain-containing protein [Castellaniella denitrificans]MCZ4331092.1 DUF4055 domain-containing protein [Castellaniella denitrificans]
MALKVQEPSAQVAGYAEDWQLVADLLGGTRAMRAAAARRLPKWPNESTESYQARLSTATLFPALARTLGVMAGKPFSKALTYGDDVPARIREWCDDADLQGTNLHTFAAGMMEEALGYGTAGVLVEYPRTDGVRTVADERAVNARPYLVRYNHNQILGWRSFRLSGVTVLTQLRLSESAEVEDGDYGTKAVDRVRVLRPGSWELWEEGEKGEYVLTDFGVTTLQKIPFVPFYGRKTGFMAGVSPLLDLAHLNVKHWQSQSDQDTILHVARVPILAAITSDEGFELTVGASSAVRIPEGGDLKFVEHGGAAIAAGRQSLQDLEDQMIQTGAELLVAKPGQRSATEANNDAEANKSELQRITEAFEDSLDQCLQFMADWVGEAQGGHVSLFKDFGAATLTDASAQLILSMQQAGLISKETAIREQQRRGMLAPDLDPTAEIERAQADGPALGTL